jgi:NADP-dependent 3-hydroxy acid dehydrogenase YdfG
MRILKEIPHQDYKITLYAWNNRYIIKIEQDFLEQTFKVNQFDVAGDEEIEKLIDTAFIAEAIDRFRSMSQSLHEGLQRL